MKKKNKLTREQHDAVNRKKIAAMVTQPHIVWTEDDDLGWQPTIYVATLSMPLRHRPIKQFLKGERDAIMVWLKIALSEMLFDVPCYIHNEKTMKTVKNPDWVNLPYGAKDEVKGKWVEVDQGPTIYQQLAEKMNNPIVER